MLCLTSPTLRSSAISATALGSSSTYPKMRLAQLILNAGIAGLLEERSGLSDIFRPQENKICLKLKPPVFKINRRRPRPRSKTWPRRSSPRCTLMTDQQIILKASLPVCSPRRVCRHRFCLEENAYCLLESSSGTAPRSRRWQ